MPARRVWATNPPKADEGPRPFVFYLSTVTPDQRRTTIVGPFGVPPNLAGSFRSLYLAPSFGDQRLAHATGFVVWCPSGPLLITCRHVVRGRDNNTDAPLHSKAAVPDRIRVRYVRQDHLQPDEFPPKRNATVVEREELLFDNESPRWIEHPTWGARMDCVALPLRNAKGLLIPIQGTPDDIEEGDARILYAPADPVSVVGFPFGESVGLLPIWATGFIASEPGARYLRPLPTMLIDCRVRTGLSGSPVILQRNFGTVFLEGGGLVADGRPRSRLIGIYSGRINVESDIGIVWTTDAIRELVTHAGDVLAAKEKPKG